MQRIRCHYPDADAFLSALSNAGVEGGLEVFTTTAFEPGEELLAEVYFGGLPGKIVLRAVGRAWHPARPRLRVRAGGVIRCAGSELRKLAFLREVAEGRIELPSRRRHVRLPVMVQVRWRRLGDHVHHMAALSELSEGGALLLTEAPLDVRDDVVVEVLPPGSEVPLEIAAVVRNVDHPEGVGLAFVARDAGGVHRLREIIRRITEE